MNTLNLSRKLAARTRPGNLLAWLLPAALILLMLFLAGGATASAQVVTNSADSGPGTLRSAITNAAGGAVITFDPNLSGATITLSNTLTINTNLTIDASALPGGLQINGNGSVQIFNVASNITVFLNSLTITNGNYTNENSFFGGGGILNYGTLTLTNCTLSGNSADHVGGQGGGIENDGTMTLNQCTLSGNSAGYDGGGIDNDYGGTATLNQCTLSGNSARFSGGIDNYSELTMNQCTLSGNSATGGYDGGGIRNDIGGYAKITITNTIVGGNSGGDIYNTYSAVIIYGGSNLVQSLLTQDAGYFTGPAPNLAPLGNYGGPTQTIRLCPARPPLARAAWPPTPSPPISAVIHERKTA
jgi:hypothetical protein